MRGGENVLERFCEILPEADIFTHAFIPEKISARIKSHRITETLVASLPFGRGHCQKYLPLMPYALSRLKLDEYDLILSSESGPVKGVKKSSSARHVCYCHTPMRYIWDMYHEYYANASFSGKLGMKLFTGYMRKYDLASADCVDEFIANSKFVAARIKRIYDREAKVVYPPVDVDFFKAYTPVERSYYLFAGQLVCYKKPDAVINAFRQMPDEQLVIVGDGPMRKTLEKSAPANVTFKGFASREDMRNLYAGAKALIFPGIEDFGIVPLEAQSAACPVLALKAGGALETVSDRKTGLFFDEAAPEKICESIEESRTVKFDFSNHVNAFQFSVSIVNYAISC